MNTVGGGVPFHPIWLLWLAILIFIVVMALRFVVAFTRGLKGTDKRTPPGTPLPPQDL